MTSPADFRVHLVAGNKSQSPASVRADMGIVKAHSPGTSAVVVNTERETPALRQAVTDGLGAGWRRVFENENTVAYGSSWAVTGPVPTPVLLAHEDPSMAKVSGRRYLDVLPLEYATAPDVALDVDALHLLSEANCEHVHVYGRAWREKWWPVQLADVLDTIEARWDHGRGRSAVIAGDFNTGIHFNGARLLEAFRARFGDHVAHAHNGALDHVFLLSTDRIRLTERGVETVTNNASDHNMVTVSIRAEIAPPTTLAEWIARYGVDLSPAAVVELRTIAPDA